MGGGDYHEDVRDLDHYGLLFDIEDWSKIIRPGDRVLEIGCADALSLFKNGKKGYNIMNLVGPEGKILVTDTDEKNAYVGFSHGKKHLGNQITFVSERDIFGHEELLEILQKHRSVIYQPSFYNAKGYIPNYFDVTLSARALYSHNDKSVTAVANLLKCTKPGGTLFLAFLPRFQGMWGFSKKKKTAPNFLKEYLKEKGFTCKVSGYGLMITKPKLSSRKAAILNEEILRDFKNIKISDLSASAFIRQVIGLFLNLLRVRKK